MNKKAGLILCFVVVAIIAEELGWLFAHATVATECEKLGGFYVGDRVFVCGKRSNHDNTN